MSQATPDDLDALLASLLVATPEPLQAPAEPVAAAPTLSSERAASHEYLRAWLAEHLPNARAVPDWQPYPDPGYEVPVPEPVEPFDPEIATELSAARAWRDGDPVAFDAALARLPSDRAEHHRRMGGICDLIKARRATRSAQTPTPEGRS